jgi:hypothetical protein
LVGSRWVRRLGRGWKYVGSRWTFVTELRLASIGAHLIVEGKRRQTTIIYEKDPMLANEGQRVLAQTHRICKSCWL